MRTRIVVSDSRELTSLFTRTSQAHIDIGCGNGLAALKLARARPDAVIIGTDICLDNLAKQVRRAPANLRFLRIDALDPLPELCGRFDTATIAFPFGSLLRGIMADDVEVLGRLLSPLKPGATIHVLINESAIQATFGKSGAMPRGLRSLARALFDVEVTRCDHTDIREWPSTWAKRIGYGKPSVTWQVTGRVSMTSLMEGVTAPMHHVTGAPLNRG